MTTKHSPAALEMAARVYGMYGMSASLHTTPEAYRELIASIIDAGNAELVSQMRTVADRLTNETPLARQIVADLLAKYSVPK